MKPGPMIYGPQGEQVADLRETLLSQEEHQANIQLMLAAPDLLNALRIAEATLQRLAPDGSRATQGTRDVISNLIAKLSRE
jgi:hypothetical protein